MSGGDMWDVTLFGGGFGGDIDFLKNKNPLPELDHNFRFDDSIDPATGQKNHSYFIVDENGERKFNGSCTGIVAEYKPPFVARDAYDGMVARGRINNPDDDYYGKTFEDCVEMWKTTGEEASEKGSRMHAEIEKFYNSAADWPNDPAWTTDPDTAPSLLRFLRFHLEVVVAQGLVPYRTELNIWHEDFEFAGQCDIIFQRREWLDDPEKRNWVIIADWKRTKKDLNVVRAYGNQCMLGVCSELQSVARNDYLIQTTLYAHVLQLRTNLRVQEIYIGVFRFNNPSYVWLRIEPRYDIVEKILAERRSRLVRQYTNTMVNCTRALREWSDQVDGSRDAVLIKMDLAARSLRGMMRHESLVMTPFGKRKR